MNAVDRQYDLINGIQSLLEDMIEARPETTLVEVLGALETIKLREWRIAEEHVDRKRLLGENEDDDE